MRRGYTVVELLLVVSIVGVVVALALPRTLLVLDRIAVHAAAADVGATLATARAVALAGRSAVAVDVDSASGTLRVRRGVERLWSRNIGQAHGVEVRTSRDSLAFDGRGLGVGAANLSIVIRRGAVAETVYVSRLGRVR